MDTVTNAILSDSTQLANGIYQYVPTNTTPIDTGNIIISIDGEGYMRKVIDVDTTGGQVTLTTVQATLVEAIEEIDLNTFLASYKSNEFEKLELTNATELK